MKTEHMKTIKFNLTMGIYPGYTKNYREMCVGIAIQAYKAIHYLCVEFPGLYGTHNIFMRDGVDIYDHFMEAINKDINPDQEYIPDLESKIPDDGEETEEFLQLMRNSYALVLLDEFANDDDRVRAVFGLLWIAFAQKEAEVANRMHCISTNISIKHSIYTDCPYSPDPTSDDDKKYYIRSGLGETVLSFTGTLNKSFPDSLTEEEYKEAVKNITARFMEFLGQKTAYLEFQEVELDYVVS